MARIFGIDLPRDKRIEAALPYLFGIGPSRARKILKDLSIDPNKRSKDVSEDDVSKITAYIQKNFMNWLKDTLNKKEFFSNGSPAVSSKSPRQQREPYLILFRM